jgi:hypothetical protein
MIPGWPYSSVVAVESGPTSWTTILDARRLMPTDNATATTAKQLRRVIENLTAGGHWQPGDPNVLIVADAGYDLPRLAWLLADLPIEVLGRVRSDRVYYGPAGTRAGPTKERPPRHGPRLAPQDAKTHSRPVVTTEADTDRYGKARAHAWARMHPKLESRGPWIDHDGPAPIIEGTLIHLQVERLPGDRDPKPVWLWMSVSVPAGGRGYRALVVDVPPPFRYRAHFPVSQTAPRMDAGTYSQSGGSGSVDGSDRDRLHAAEARSSTGEGLPVAVAEAATTRETHPCSRACGLSPHPPDTDSSGVCADSLQTGSRTSPTTPEHDQDTHPTSRQSRLRG